MGAFLFLLEDSYNMSCFLGLKIGCIKVGTVLSSTTFFVTPTFAFLISVLTDLIGITGASVMPRGGSSKNGRMTAFFISNKV